MCSGFIFCVQCRTLNGLLELVKGVGKIQGSTIHEVSLIPGYPFSISAVKF